MGNQENLPRKRRQSARRFRKQSFVTTITGPDGKPVDELDETDGEPARLCAGGAGGL